MTAIITPVMISLAHILAYPALIVPELRNANNTMQMNQEDGSWYTSIFSLCSPIGSLICGIMMDKYGRKITLVTPLIPIMLIWIVTATATNLTVLFTSRAFLGIFGGFGPPICQVNFSLLSIEQMEQI